MAQVAYDEKKYRKGIDTSFYTNAVNDYKKQQETNRANQINAAAASRDSALRQAYISKMQNEQQLNQNLASQGIRGGATETSNLRLANIYGTQRAAANTDYANSVTAINRGIDQNIADYTSDMNSRAEQYRQNMAQARWNAAREDANLKEQYAREDAQLKAQNKREDAIRKEQYKREDEANKYNRNATEVNRLTEYWSNYYINYYSGVKKKTLDKALKSAKTNLKNAKTQAQKIRYQQQIAGIQARRGVIANK